MERKGFLDRLSSTSALTRAFVLMLCETLFSCTMASSKSVTVDYLFTGNQKENPSQQPQSEVDATVERIRRKLESMPKEQREALMNLIEKM